MIFLGRSSLFSAFERRQGELHSFDCKALIADSDMLTTAGIFRKLHCDNSLHIPCLFNNAFSEGTKLYLLCLQQKKLSWVLRKTLSKSPMSHRTEIIQKPELTPSLHYGTSVKCCDNTTFFHPSLFILHAATPFPQIFHFLLFLQQKLVKPG